MTANRVASIVILLVAVQYIRLARTYRGLTVADVVGPSAYPILLGALMAVLAVFLFFQSKPRATGETFWAQHGRPLLLLGSLFAYIMLLEPVGFLVTTSVYLALAMVWLGERRRARAAGLGMALALTLWLIFDRALSLRLPPGVLGFLP